MGFITTPPSRQVPKTFFWQQTKWALTGPLLYRAKDGTLYTVPENFEHDVSIPRFLWPILPPTGPYSRSAALHDFTNNDELFLEAMLSEEDMEEWLAYVMYFSVTGDNPKKYDDITTQENDNNNSILGGG